MHRERNRETETITIEWRKAHFHAITLMCVIYEIATNSSNIEEIHRPYTVRQNMEST